VKIKLTFLSKRSDNLEDETSINSVMPSYPGKMQHYDEAWDVGLAPAHCFNTVVSDGDYPRPHSLAEDAYTGIFSKRKT
jgi:hypothetical protein